MHGLSTAGHLMISRGYMDLALAEARAAATRGEVPVGAVIVRLTAWCWRGPATERGNSTT
jgi:tRNA(Arg) A34 adenosine deaminase TadA